MIVDQIEIERVAVLEAKNQPPIASDGNAPEAFKIALERVQPPTGHHIHFLNGFGRIQGGQNILDLVHLISRKPAALSVSNSRFSAL
jgi:hypothetical protein